MNDFAALVDRAGQLCRAIAGRHQERQLARKADFEALVKAVAEEQEPDPEEVERILVESNKTQEDLQQAVELYLKRRSPAWPTRLHPRSGHPPDSYNARNDAASSKSCRRSWPCPGLLLRQLVQ
jgi:hypothetical protein